MRQRGATSWGGLPRGGGGVEKWWRWKGQRRRALEMLLCSTGFAFGGIRQLQHAQLLPQLENVPRNV